MSMKGRAKERCGKLRAHCLPFFLGAVAFAPLLGQQVRFRGPLALRQIK